MENSQHRSRERATDSAFDTRLQSVWARRVAQGQVADSEPEAGSIEALRLVAGLIAASKADIIASIKARWPEPGSGPVEAATEPRS